MGRKLTDPAYKEIFERKMSMSFYVRVIKIPAILWFQVIQLKRVATIDFFAFTLFFFCIQSES